MSLFITPGAAASAGSSVTVSDTTPASPSSGNLWWKSDEGALKIYYQDGDSSQWVDASLNSVGPNALGLNLSDKTSSYQLLLSDAGSVISITTGGVTIPAGVFAPGNAVTIFNNSSSSQTITATAVTCYLAGTATTGNRTLAQRGLATIVCVATNTFVISGVGLT